MRAPSPRPVLFAAAALQLVGAGALVVVWLQTPADAGAQIVALACAVILAVFGVGALVAAARTPRRRR